MVSPHVKRDAVQNFAIAVTDAKIHNRNGRFDRIGIIHSEHSSLRPLGLPWMAPNGPNSGMGTVSEIPRPHLGYDGSRK